MTDRRFKKLIDLSTTCQNWQLWQRKLIQNPIQRPVLHLLLLLSAPHFHCFLPSGQRSTGATVHLSDSLSHTHSYLSYTHKHTHTHWESSCSVSSHRRQNTEPIKAEGNQWNSRAPTSRVGRLKRRLTEVARKQQLRQYTSKKNPLMSMTWRQMWGCKPLHTFPQKHLINIPVCIYSLKCAHVKMAQRNPIQPWFTAVMQESIEPDI